MRVVTLLLVVLVAAVFAFGAIARGEEDAPAKDTSPEVQALERKVAILEQQVAYLLARDASLTAYVLAHEDQGKDLVALATRMRAQGFAARAIPAESRETLLKGLEALGEGLQTDVPAVTKEQQALLAAAARAR